MWFAFVAAVGGVGFEDVAVATFQLFQDCGFVDYAGTAVVGGDGQRPVVVEGVEVLEVAACGARGEHGIAPFVDQRVDLQAVDLARAGHELPHAGGAHARYGRG